MSADKHPRVGIINSNEEILAMLRELLVEEGFSVSTAHVFDFKTARQSFLQFLSEWDPHVLVYDIAPPYESNWRFFETLRALPSMKGRAVVITTTNKKLLAELTGEGHALEIVGKPADMQTIVAAVERAAAKRRAA